MVEVKVVVVKVGALRAEKVLLILREDGAGRIQQDGEWTMASGILDMPAVAHNTWVLEWP